MCVRNGSVTCVFDELRLPPPQACRRPDLNPQLAGDGLSSGTSAACLLLMEMALLLHGARTDQGAGCC